MREELSKRLSGSIGLTDFLIFQRSTVYMNSRDADNVLVSKNNPDSLRLFSIGRQ